MNVEPLVAMVTEREWALAFRRPHAACNRLEADAMLVHRPDFDRRARVLSFLLSNGPLKFFFKLRSILLRRCFGVTWSRLLDRVRDTDERIPATLVVHRL